MKNKKSLGTKFFEGQGNFGKLTLRRLKRRHRGKRAGEGTHGTAFGKS